MSSDRSLKTGIQRLNGSLAGVLALNGYSYHRKSVADQTRREIGVIAQEVQEIFPALVSENAEGILAVNYAALVPVLIEAIKAVLN